MKNDAGKEAKNPNKRKKNDQLSSPTRTLSLTLKSAVQMLSFYRTLLRKPKVPLVPCTLTALKTPSADSLKYRNYGIYYSLCSPNYNVILSI